MQILTNGSSSSQSSGQCKWQVALGVTASCRSCLAGPECERANRTWSPSPTALQKRLEMWWWVIRLGFAAFVPFFFNFAALVFTLYSFNSLPSSTFSFCIRKPEWAVCYVPRGHLCARLSCGKHTSRCSKNAAHIFSTYTLNNNLT